MNENNKNLKDIWNKAENLLDSSSYESSTIEKFLTKRSNSTAQRMKNMIFINIVLKTVVVFIIKINIFLYMGTSNIVAICITAIILLVLLIIFQFKMLNRFSEIADYGQSTKQKLTSMLTYLRSGFFSTLLANGIGYPFMFISGMLVYFYAAYGYVRPLDGQDITVFSIIILFGIGFTLFINHKQIEYQIKHLEACLSDLNDSSLIMVSNNLEKERKQDITIKILLMIVLVFGFVLLIAVFKNIGFLIK